jgi:hypothetical protein
LTLVGKPCGERLESNTCDFRLTGRESEVGDYEGSDQGQRSRVE